MVERKLKFYVMGLNASCTFVDNNLLPEIVAKTSTLSIALCECIKSIDSFVGIIICYCVCFDSNANH